MVETTLVGPPPFQAPPGAVPSKPAPASRSGPSCLLEEGC